MASTATSAANAATPSDVNFFMFGSQNDDMTCDTTPRRCLERLSNEAKSTRLRTEQKKTTGAAVRRGCCGARVYKAGLSRYDAPPLMYGAPSTSETPMNKALTAALGLLLAVALTACGSGKSDKHVSLSKDEKTAVKSLEKAFTQSATGALTTKEAKCVATDFVDSVGLKKLKSAKLLTDSYEVNTSTSPDFDAGTAGKFADSLLGCVDYQKRLATETAKTDKTIDAAKFEDCLKDKLPDSLVKKMLVASQTQASDSAEIGAEGNKAMTDCKASATKK